MQVIQLYIEGVFIRRLQNSRIFLKISKEIGKAWHKSLTRAKRTRGVLGERNGNCPWLGEAGNLNEYNVCKTDSPYF